MAGISIERFPLHLGLGATALPQPEFTGAMDWYEAYSERNAADGGEGRLVTTHTFTEDWTSWEVHPAGAEVVLCLSGEMTLHQEFPDGHLEQVTIGAGEYAINLPGVWHTADVAGTATTLFITAGAGTQHRPR
ncbi:MAG: cupin [Pseudomonadota bacterium]|nr:cupin [Pseudomonadota bacterium]